MAQATGSKVQLTYVAESTYGTTPGTPAMVEVPFISSALNLTKGLFEDPSIQADRQVHYARHGNKAIAGDVSFAYTHSNFDPFFESLFMSTFSTNVLKTGSAQLAHTIEVAHTDITQYLVYTGVIADTMSLEVNLDGVVQSTFSFVGKDMTISGTALDASPTAATDEQPFVHFDGTFKENDVAVANLTSINLSITNTNAENRALGSDTVVNYSPGMFKVTGTVTAYFEDATYVNKFINETASSIEFVLDDGAGNTHTYLIPNIKYTGGDTPVSGEGPVMVNLPFIALYDETEATTVKLTRS